MRGPWNLSASPHEHRIKESVTGWVGPRARDHRADGDRWPAVASLMLVPKLIADAGENTSDFFTANIRNPNTRAAWAVAVCAARGGEEEMWRSALRHNS